jgi:hypothetical protein
MRVVPALAIALAALGLFGCSPPEDTGSKAPAAQETASSRDQENKIAQVEQAAPTVRPPVQREWGPDVHVKPGSSMANGSRQEIRLTSVTEYREILNEKLWFAGFGGARVNGGSALFSWNSTTPPPLEIEIANDASETFLECEKLIKAGIPSGRALSISGHGRFKSLPAAGQFLGWFKLHEVDACGLQ